MILDRIECYEKYQHFIKNLKNGFDFIRVSENLPVGRYEFSGWFALIQEGETYPAEEGVFETHKKYIDIQYLASGTECLEWNTVMFLKQTEAYDEKKDIAFYHGTGTKIQIEPGMFTILFPSDAHKACCHVSKASHYRKVVLKLEIKE